jgi:hypothetical protein
MVQKAVFIGQNESVDTGQNIGCGAAYPCCFLILIYCWNFVCEHVDLIF